MKHVQSFSEFKLNESVDGTKVLTELIEKCPFDRFWWVPEDTSVGSKRVQVFSKKSVEELLNGESKEPRCMITSSKEVFEKCSSILKNKFTPFFCEEMSGREICDLAEKNGWEVVPGCKI